MSIERNKTIKDLVAETPAITRALEQLGIDYCCGGGRTLEEACAAGGLNINEVIAELRRAGQVGSASREPDWRSEPLENIISRIVDRHHAYVKRELPRLDKLMAKVSSVHGERHPELQSLRGFFQGLDSELSQHMHKEEVILFPHIIEMEQAAVLKQPAPMPFFGTVQNPIRMMIDEHESAGQALRDMRRVTANFSVPKDGCVSFQTLYQALEAFELDLHEHIYLENNILFPRAVELEEKLFSAASASR